MCRKSIQSKQFLKPEDLVNSLVCVPDHQMPATSPALVKLRRLIGRPAPLSTDTIHLCGIDWVIFGSGLLTVLTEERMHMHAYAKGGGIMLKVRIHMPVIIEQGLEMV